MDVTAGSKEVPTGTDNVELSCTVTGITTKLQSVQWINSDGADVKDLFGFTVTEAQFGVAGHISTLTVSKKQTVDAEYFCIITPSSPDDTTTLTTVVNIDVYSK